MVGLLLLGLLLPLLLLLLLLLLLGFAASAGGDSGSDEEALQGMHVSSKSIPCLLIMDTNEQASALC